MMNFLALHYIAAHRGDGLRPELVRLLERWKGPQNAESDEGVWRLPTERNDHGGGTERGVQGRAVSA